MAVSGLQSVSTSTPSQFDVNNRGLSGPQTDHDANNSIVSEQSNNLGEIKRGRVRHFFQERTIGNGGATSQSSYELRIKKRLGPQLLGTGECERVQIIRECVQTNTKHVNVTDHGSDRDVGVAEVGSRIEQVRDGAEASYTDAGARRPLRKLCGRQTLLDLLLRAQSERKRELHCLLEKKRVSNFVHRNRIQALLRGRFLRNETLIPDERPSSMAVTELGLLRQRLTVSDLREGFLSKLDNSASNSVNNDEFDSSSRDENIDESDTSSRDEINDENSGVHIIPDSECIVDKNRILQESVAQVAEAERPVSDNDESKQDILLEQNLNVFITNESAYVNNDGSPEIYHEQCESRSGARYVDEVDKSDASLSDENSGVHMITDFKIILDKNSSLHESVAQVTQAEDPFSDNDESEHDVLLEQNVNISLISESDHVNNDMPLEIYNEHNESRSGASYVDEVDEHTNELERDTTEEFYLQANDASGQAEESQDSAIDIRNGVWQQLNSVLTEWANDEDHAQMQESRVEDWRSQDLQEAIDNWLDMPLGEVGQSVGRLNTLYFPDEDDNVHTLELRELSSRRRVSSLLRSGFRESLDQVLRSLVERHAHASGDSEPDHTFSSRLLIEQDQEQIGGGDHLLALYNEAERNPFTPSSALVAGSHPLWNEEFQGVNWPHNNSNSQLGKEWEVINGLRIEMVRLNQRMNDMQSVLETCIDMQIELQRSVRQELSAALNRSSNLSGDAYKESKHNDESQWDHIRKGICCLCRDSKIDSLLYRCGHMCTCSMCGENLIQCKGKCPCVVLQQLRWSELISSSNKRETAHIVGENTKN